MKRMLTIVALLAGGLAAELMYPVQCLLIAPKATSIKRKTR
ncbi:hypothetical protein [Paraburkholderia bryophila]|jgi:hypothetical protein|uniref:Uncharacterized protein n=1 Tax=Paraburkholderia bryophila TaxID=420952 RepID=A0A329CXX1_9BURK|nr:hypothetical protein [Paraburkholderia bryophila]RAS35585.1 hypothetical protein BX591_105304 [Paraburkholderia bryophila]